MTSTRRLVTNHRETKEFDSVKESISDIINQLQDIDPARLSFSPFLDLDTQISLAPVSDSPESSVEELHSSTHSVPGSQHSLEPQPTGHLGRLHSCLQRSSESFTEQHKQYDGEEGLLDDTVASDTAAVHNIENLTENSTPDFQKGIPNGGDRQLSPSETINLESTIGEGHPLIRSPPESIELAMWNTPEQQGCEDGLVVTDREQCCCCYGCCKSARMPALFSLLASLVCLPGILYALYVYIPIDAPHCPDMVSRLIFTLSCCAVATVPILLAMLTGAVCRFCSGSLDPVVPSSSGPALLQLFVASSMEQLSLYILNLVVLATFLPQGQLRIVPILSGVFVGGRLVYWLSLHVCSSWRGFGSGLTVFPLLTMVVFNLYCLFDLGFRKLIFGSEDIIYVHTSPSPWPLEM